MERVCHDGRETAYRVSGSGARTLCFVHGSGGSHAVWKSQFRLTDAYRVVALDLSGHGESADVDGGRADVSTGADSPADDAVPDALDVYVEDVAAVTAATDADVLVGNSLGGAVCLATCLDGAFDPGALVLAGSGAKLSVHEDLRDLLATDFPTAVDVLHRPGYLFADPEERLVEASKALLTDCGQAVTRRDFLTCHRFDIRDRLGEIGVPTLAVVGSEDGLTPPAYHEYLAESIPDGTYHEIADAGHLAMLERPTAFNDALRTFLDDRL